MARRKARKVGSTWDLEGVTLTYCHPPRNDRPGVFVCSEHGEQHERKIERWVYAPEPACEHVMRIGNRNGFWPTKTVHPVDKKGEIIA